MDRIVTTHLTVANSILVLTKALLVLLIALSLLVVGQAQQIPISSYVAFDGQPVSLVDIAIRPDVDREKISNLILVKSGKPFSQDEMRASIAALQKSQLFTQVQVNVQPEQTGLHITFILQPAEYVGILTFPGTGHAFPYTALLQAADIPEQSPYVQGMESGSIPGLATYLRGQGYFAAQISAGTARETPGIVNVVFRCVLGKRAKVRNIEFSGISESQGIKVQSALKSWWSRLKRTSLKPGQAFSQQRIDKSIALIRNHLRTAGALDPVVHLATPQFDASSNVVDLTFEVTPGSKVSVQVAGAKVSDKKLRQLIPIYEERTVDQDLIDEGEANLQSYFQGKGYFEVSVDSDTTEDGETVNVVYKVTPGDRHKVKGVYFDGNRYFPDRDLEQNLAIKKGFFFKRGLFNEQLLNKSVAALTQRYKDAGFQNISIRPKVQDFNPDVVITFQIDEGMQDHVVSLQLVGNKTLSPQQLGRKFPLKLKVGKLYSPRLLEFDRSQLLAAYLDRGYLNASVTSSASAEGVDSHKVNVTFTIQEGPEVSVSNVAILGADHTSSQYVERILRGVAKPSRPISESNFLQGESDLYDLGIFDRTSIETARPIADQTKEEVLIKLHESPRNSIDVSGGIEIIPRDGSIPVNSVAVPGLPPVSLGNNYSVSQKSYVGPRFTFDFTRLNLWGRAETATIGVIASRLDQKAFFTYSDPHLKGSNWSTLFNASTERTTENPVYTADLGTLSFQLEKFLNAKKSKSLIARYSFQQTDLSNILIPDLVLPEDQHVRLSTFDAEYIRDSRDVALDAHRGIYQTFDVGITSTALGATQNFVRFLGQNAFYLPLKPWLVFANNFRLGIAGSFADSHVPQSERFFSGGSDSLRGFPIDGAGPQRPVAVCSNPADQATCTLISVPVGGDMLFIVNSELRFSLSRIKSGIGAVLFYDGGNVYSNINLRQFADDFTHSVGVGVRYKTPVGPVRVDLGYRLTNVPGVKAVQYFVTFGQSF